VVLGSHGELGIGTRISWTDDLCRVKFDSSLNRNQGHGHQLNTLNETSPEVVVYIAAGHNYSALVTRRKTVAANLMTEVHVQELYTFGGGIYYRLGHGSTEDCLYPTRVSQLAEVLSEDWCMQSTTAGRDRVELGVQRVACGCWHMVAVSFGMNDVYSWYAVS
jgi:alpha-tubulin suppressor-like RCC1 family protein